MAFLFGGMILYARTSLICFIPTSRARRKDARSVVSVTFIFVAALLTALNVFDNIAKHAGAGTLVPITGFANAMVSPAIEFKTEGFVTGVGAKCSSLPARSSFMVFPPLFCTVLFYTSSAYFNRRRASLPKDKERIHFSFFKSPPSSLCRRCRKKERKAR